jgi:iron(III) transport system ATP-binding protein
VSFAGATLQVVGAGLAAGATVPVAIRQHDIQLSTQVPGNPQNALKARVTRQVFLGASRDYLVEVADGTALRVVTAPDNIVAEGADVWLNLPPERCRALSR